MKPGIFLTDFVKLINKHFREKGTGDVTNVFASDAAVPYVRVSHTVTSGGHAMVRPILVQGPT